MLKKIYTRTGDKGKTTLYPNKRVAKNDPLVEAIGTIDETMSALGVALAFLPNEPKFKQVRDQIVAVQYALFDISADLGVQIYSQERKEVEINRYGHEAVALLEKWIDVMDTHMPPLNAFILPGGQTPGAYLHFACSVARRCERRVVPLYELKYVSEEALVYMNRISDYLYTTCRFVNHLMGFSEIQWSSIKPASS